MGLWVAISSRHSVRTAVRHLRWNLDQPAVVGVTEHGLDHLHPVSIQAFPVLCGQDGSHPRVSAAGPTRPGLLATARVGSDQHVDVPAGDHLVHVLFVLVLRVGQRDLGPLPDPDPFKLRQRGCDHRAQVGEIAGGVGDLRSR